MPISIDATVALGITLRAAFVDARSALPVMTPQGYLGACRALRDRRGDAGDGG